MGRMYVESTPYTRGELEVPAEGLPATPASADDLTLEQVQSAAERLGHTLVDASATPDPLTEDELEAQASAAGFDLVARPKGNDSAEEWAAYARRLGAVDADMVDSDGKPLGRDALRAKYGPKAE